MIVAGFQGLPEELQRAVADFTSRQNPADPNAARESLTRSWGDNKDKNESDESTLHPNSSYDTHHEDQEDRNLHR